MTYSSKSDAEDDITPILHLQRHKIHEKFAYSSVIMYLRALKAANMQRLRDPNRGVSRARTDKLGLVRSDRCVLAGHVLGWKRE